jgi:ribosome modulation factor
MDESKAFEEGVEAFSRGKNRDDCPYPAQDEARRKRWLEGWDKAKRADDLLVDGLP